MVNVIPSLRPPTSIIQFIKNINKQNKHKKTMKNLCLNFVIFKKKGIT